MKCRTKLFFAALLIITISSCSVYRDKTSTEELDLPQMVLENATYTFKQSNRNPLILKADKITVWPQNITELEIVSFSEEENGEVTLWGSCNEAESKDNTEIKLKGNVKLFRKTDNITIECEGLEWNDSKQTISTSGSVFVSYQDGTEIAAEGFKASLKDNEYSFERIIRGRFKTDE